MTWPLCILHIVRLVKLIEAAAGCPDLSMFLQQGEVSCVYGGINNGCKQQPSGSDTSDCAL